MCVSECAWLFACCVCCLFGLLFVCVCVWLSLCVVVVVVVVYRSTRVVSCTRARTYSDVCMGVVCWHVRTGHVPLFMPLFTRPRNPSPRRPSTFPFGLLYSLAGFDVHDHRLAVHDSRLGSWHHASAHHTSITALRGGSTGRLTHLQAICVQCKKQ